MKKLAIRGPQLPESVQDGVLLTWHKQIGERVSAQELLAEIETDKVVLEVVAPASGKLLELNRKEGDTVGSAEVLAFMEDQGLSPESPEPDTGVPVKAGPGKGGHGDQSNAVAVSKSARRLLKEHGIDEHKVKGSGKSGRILKEDVLAQVNRRASAEVGHTPTVEVETRRVPMSRLRQKVAERMLLASQSTASLTTFNEVDMSAVLDLRRKYGDRFETRHGVRLGLMSFFVRAATEALCVFPELNASVDGTDIIYHGDCHIGVAVSTDRGLVVPVLRSTRNMNLWNIERAVATYAERARNNDLSIEDMQGGTFTISNGGVFGSMLSTPILNPPQTGILGMHKIMQRPVVIDGAVVARPMMYLALSYDHRLVDGREAVGFLVRVKEIVEHPAELLLDLGG